MLREHSTVLRRTLIIFDVCIITAAFFVTYLARIYHSGYKPLSDYLWFLPIFAILWSFLLYRGGAYKSFRTKEAIESFYIIFRSGFTGLLIVSAVIYFTKSPKISRNFVAFSYLAATLALCLEKALLILVFRSLRKKGYNTRFILIAGLNKRTQQFIDVIKGHAEWGFKIIGIIDADPANNGKEIDGLKVIGSFSDLPNILHTNVVDEVVFVVPHSLLDRVGEMVSFCELEGIKASVAVDLFELKFAKAKQEELHGFPLLSFESSPSKFWPLFFKRFTDILISLVGLIILSPVFLIVAIIIKLISPGQVFFKQKRSGLKGRVFTLYKFRTMVEGAEEKLEALRAKNEMTGPVFKLENDPRITPVGTLLRKLSIDELPQLWNVLVGHMSIVGPRPPLPSEVNQYDPWQRRRLSMRPGITCLWQVGGRNKIKEFEKWVKLDLEYIDNWSLALDGKIILKTVPVVLFGIGAK